MSISNNIIQKANPPTDNIVVVIQIRMILDMEELRELSSDYDFWTMLQDFSPPVDIISAHMETKRPTTK